MSGLEFTVDLSSLEDLAKSLELEGDQIWAAFSRALRRTQGTLRVDSVRGLKPRLNLKTTSRLRRRVKVFASRREQEITIWFGQNNFPMRDFKGRATQGADGVSFRGHIFPDAFLGRAGKGGKYSAWRRIGAARLPIQKVTLPVKHEMDAFLEETLMDKVGDLLLANFEHEIKARGIFGVGKKR